MKLKDVRHVMNATMAADQAEEDARIQTVFGSLAKSLLTRLGVSRRRLWSAFPYLRRNWPKLHKHRVKRWLRRRVGLPEWPRAGAHGG